MSFDREGVLLATGNDRGRVRVYDFDDVRAADVGGRNGISRMELSWSSGRLMKRRRQRPTNATTTRDAGEGAAGGIDDKDDDYGDDKDNDNGDDDDTSIDSPGDRHDDRTVYDDYDNEDCGSGEMKLGRPDLPSPRVGPARAVLPMRGWSGHGKGKEQRPSAHQRRPVESRRSGLPRRVFRKLTGVAHLRRCKRRNAPPVHSTRGRRSVPRRSAIARRGYDGGALHAGYRALVYRTSCRRC
jgi:hypothetical protein